MSSRTVEQGELTAESAQRALRAAGVQVGLATDGAHLIRMGSNAVFRIPGNVVARVARSASMFDNAKKQVDVAEWLEAKHIPAVRALDLQQPVIADERVVTFWRSESDQEVYADIEDVADLIRQTARTGGAGRYPASSAATLRQARRPASGLFRPFE